MFIALYISLIFQIYLYEGIVSNDLKPNSCLQDRNRNIASTSFSCKLLEHIIVTAIFQHLENHQIIIVSCYVFCAKRSYPTIILALYDELVNGLDKQKLKQKCMIIMDLYKVVFHSSSMPTPQGVSLCYT